MSDYPRMLYHEDGRQIVASSAEAEDALAGFRREPFDVHRNEGGKQPDTVTAVPSSSSDDLALHVADVVIARLLERFDLAPKDDGPPVDDDIARPRRGRPPKVRAEADAITDAEA